MTLNALTFDTGDDAGYTLLELVVVVVLIGLIMTITIPKIREPLLSDSLKNSVRKLSATVDNLRNDAVRENRVYYLNVQFETGRIWVSEEGMTPEGFASAKEKATILPESVRIHDIVFQGKGQIASDEAAIRFSPKGYVTPCMIHVSSSDGRNMTVVLEPFLRKTEILEDDAGFDAHG